MVEKIAGSFAYMTLPGNHESANNFTHYINRFNMPFNKASQNTSWYYSFDLGPAHFVMLDTEVYFYNSNETIEFQKSWFLDDLAKANANRSLRPWLIVLSHHPLYCSMDYREKMVQDNGDCGDDALLLQEALEDIFYDSGVDLYIQAHVHNYERNTAIYKNQTVPSEFDGPNIHIGAKAPIYITNGNAGNYLAHNDPTSPTPQDWSQFWSNDYGYAKMSIYNNTHLFYEQFSSPELECIDYVWIIKTQNRYNS